MNKKLSGSETRALSYVMGKENMEIVDVDGFGFVQTITKTNDGVKAEYRPVDDASNSFEGFLSFFAKLSGKTKQKFIEDIAQELEMSVNTLMEVLLYEFENDLWEDEEEGND